MPRRRSAGACWAFFRKHSIGRQRLRFGTPNKDPAEDTLGLLTQYSMLEWNEKTRRYRLHDLMRDFARQKLSDEEKYEASLRHARHYLAALKNADDLYIKGGASVLSGLGLFDLERTNIEAGQAWAASHGEDNKLAAEVCKRYLEAGVYCLYLRQRPRERIHWLEAGLAAARRLKDKYAEGMHAGGLGIAYGELGEYRRGIEYFEKDLEIAREVGDRKGEGQALGNLGNCFNLWASSAEPLSITRSVWRSRARSGIGWAKARR